MGKKKQLKSDLKKTRKILDTAWEDYLSLREELRYMHAPNYDGSCLECSKPFPCPTNLRVINGGRATAGEDIAASLPEPNGEFSPHAEEDRYRKDLMFDMADPLWIPQGSPPKDEDGVREMRGVDDEVLYHERRGNE